MAGRLSRRKLKKYAKQVGLPFRKVKKRQNPDFNVGSLLLMGGGIYILYAYFYNKWPFSATATASNMTTTTSVSPGSPTGVSITDAVSAGTMSNSQYNLTADPAWALAYKALNDYNNWDSASKAANPSPNPDLSKYPVLRPDTWGYYYKQITNQSAPNPSALGLDSTKFYTATQYISSLTGTPITSTPGLPAGSSSTTVTSVKPPTTSPVNVNQTGTTTPQTPSVVASTWNNFVSNIASAMTLAAKAASSYGGWDSASKAANPPVSNPNAPNFPWPNYPVLGPFQWGYYYSQLTNQPAPDPSVLGLDPTKFYTATQYVNSKKGLSGFLQMNNYARPYNYGMGCMGDCGMGELRISDILYRTFSNPHMGAQGSGNQVARGPRGSGQVYTSHWEVANKYIM
jgi:hypothetical protein